MDPRLLIRVSEEILRHRVIVVIASIIFALITGLGAKNLSITRSHEIYFEENDPHRTAFDHLQDVYTKDENVLIVLQPNDKNIFNRKILSLIEKITTDAWQIPYAQRVDSITNFQFTYAKGDTLVVEDLVRNGPHLTDVDISKSREVALNEPAIVGRLLDRKGSLTAVNVHIHLPKLDERLETREVVSYVRALVNKYQSAGEGVEFYLTGRIMMNNAFTEAALQDFITLIPISIFTMLLLIAVINRTVIPALVAFAVISISIISALGFSGYVGYPISPPTSTAPIIILTVGIANCVHIFSGYKHAYAKHQRNRAAIRESVVRNIKPIAIASLTTAVCFVSLNFSDVPPFRHLGNIVAVGVIISFALSVTLFPALLSFFPQPKLANNRASTELMTAVSKFVIEKRFITLIAVVILLPICVYGLFENRLNDTFLKYFDKGIQFRTDSDFTVTNLTGLYTLEYSLDSGRAEGIYDEIFLREVEALTSWLRTTPGVRHVASITDRLKRLNQNLHSDSFDEYKLPKSRQEAAQYLLLYEMSLPYGLDLNDRINIDKSSLRLTVAIETLSSTEVLKLDKEISQWISGNSEKIINTNATGTTMMFAHIGQKNIKSMLITISVALVSVSVLLYFIFGSLKLATISLIPNLLPAVIAFGIWGLSVGEIGLALSVVTSMTLGIIIDDTVHFINRFQEQFNQRSQSAQIAIDNTFIEVGPALFVTSLVLVLGFFLLAFSSFEVNSSMGLMTSLIIAIALIVDYIVLPPLLFLFYSDKEKSQRTIT